MARKKEPQVVNPAPKYDPYVRPPGAAPSAPGTGITAPNGPYSDPAPVGAVMVGPPPARQDQKPFINVTFLWQLGRPFGATIKGIRDATNDGNSAFNKPGQAPKRAWYLDVTLEDGREVTGRINEGDTRHQKLWAAYQGQWIGKRITLRLTNPGDIDPASNKPSKALWMLDCN